MVRIWTLVGILSMTVSLSASAETLNPTPTATPVPVASAAPEIATPEPKLKKITSVHCENVAQEAWTLKLLASGKWSLEIVVPDGKTESGEIDCQFNSENPLLFACAWIIGGKTTDQMAAQTSQVSVDTPSVVAGKLTMKHLEMINVVYGSDTNSSLYANGFTTDKSSCQIVTE